MSKPKSILKPAASAGSSVSFRVPADLAARLSAVRVASHQRALVFDIDPALAKALARLVRQAEIELAESASGVSPQQPVELSVQHSREVPNEI